MGRSEAALPATFVGGGDAVIRTAFNPAYLLDAIKTLDSEEIVIDIDQNGYGCDGKVFAKPALIYDRYNAVVRWVLMPVNAGLGATRENLGSNYPEHLDEEAGAAEQGPLPQRRPPDETPYTAVSGMRRAGTRYHGTTLRSRDLRRRPGH